MSLYSSEFLHQFTSGEIKEISIDIEGTKKTFYIRRLPYHTCSQFRYKAQQMVYRAEFDAMMNANKPSFSFFKEDVEKSEFYLLRKSICDPQGTIIFDDNDEDFLNWLNIVNDDIANDFVFEIMKFNKLLKLSDEDDIIAARKERREDEKKN